MLCLSLTSSKPLAKSSHAARSNSSIPVFAARSDSWACRRKPGLPYPLLPADFRHGDTAAPGGLCPRAFFLAGVTAFGSSGDGLSVLAYLSARDFLGALELVPLANLLSRFFRIAILAVFSVSGSTTLRLPPEPMTSSVREFPFRLIYAARPSLMRSGRNYSGRMLNADITGSWIL